MSAPFQTDRRGSRQRRSRWIPVALDRRARRDRRNGSRPAADQCQDIGWLDRISAIWSQPERVPGVVVSVCHGIAGSLYAAWEAHDGGTNGARCRQFNGLPHRQIGGRSPDEPASDDTVRLLAREYRRAYSYIYREYPHIEGVGFEIEGTVLVKVPGMID